MRNPFGQLLDNAAIFRYHRQRIRAHGTNDPRSLGWARTESQLIRFRVLAQIGDLAHRSVLDAGCGYADLYPFLRQHYAGVQYHGIEQIPEMLAVARDRYPDAPGLTLSGGDFLRTPLPPADYVLASGALNYRHRDPQFVYRALEKLYSSCRVGLGFNLLDWEPADGGPLAAHDPAQVLAFCQRLGTRAELRQGYLEGDFTVFVYRQAAFSGNC